MLMGYKKWQVVGMFIGQLLFVVICFAAAFDSLLDLPLRALFFICGAIFSLFLIVFVWRIFGRTARGALLGVVLVLIVVGVTLVGASIYAQRSAPGTEAALRIMNDQRQIALRCIEKQNDLEVIRRSWFGIENGLPVKVSAMCAQEESWIQLPQGWRYNKVEDANVADRTFSFSARSRDGKQIRCTERECIISDEIGMEE